MALELALCSDSHKVARYEMNKVPAETGREKDTMHSVTACRGARKESEWDESKSWQVS